VAQQQVTLTITAKDDGTILAVTQGIDKLIKAAERAGSTASQPIAPKVDPSGIISLEEHFSNLTFGIQRFARVAVSIQVVLATVIGALGIRAILEAADAWTLMANRLSLVEQTSGGVVAIQERLFRLAQDVRFPINDMVQLFAKLSISAKDLGVNQVQLLLLTKGLAEAMQLSGLNAQDASQGMMQFMKALASGTLQARELRMMLETQPRLLQALADGLAVVSPKFNALRDSGMGATEALQHMMKAGVLDSGLILQAFLTQVAALDAEFGKLSRTIGTAWTQVMNQIEKGMQHVDTQPLLAALDKLRAWFADPSTQQAIQSFANGILDALALLVDKIPGIVQAIQGHIDALGGAMNAMMPVLDPIFTALRQGLTDFLNLPPLVQEVGIIAAVLFGVEGLGLIYASTEVVAHIQRIYAALKAGMSLTDLMRSNAKDVDAFLVEQEAAAARARALIDDLKSAQGGFGGLTGRDYLSPGQNFMTMQKSGLDALLEATMKQIAAEKALAEAQIARLKPTDAQLLKELEHLDKVAKAKIELIRLDGLVASGGVKLSAYNIEAIGKEADAERELLSLQQHKVAQMSAGSDEQAKGNKEIADTRLKIEQLTLQYHALNAEIASADLRRFDELQKAMIAAYETGAVAIKHNAALAISVAQQTYQIKHDELAKTLTDEQQLDAALVESKKTRDNTIATIGINTFKKLHDLAVSYAVEFLTIEKSKLDAATAASHQATEIALKDLDIEAKARQNNFDAGLISLNELVAAERKASDQRAALALVDLSVVRSTILAEAELKKQQLQVQFGPKIGPGGEQILGDAAKLGQGLVALDVDTQKQLQANSAATQAVFQQHRSTNLDLTKQAEAEKVRILGEAADEQIRMSNETAQKILDSDEQSIQRRIRAQATLYENSKTQYDKDVQQTVEANLQKVGIYQSESQKQIEIAAKTYEAIQQRREEDVRNAATVGEALARQAGDLGAAYVVGFSEAALSAVTAFRAMRTAGTQTYDALKAGTSDFLFEILSTSGKIGDVMVNLGKRILRTMTDAFAEIAVKWAMTAAGFTLPTLLSTGTAIAGAAAGFEGAPNQAATAVTQLATSAQTANVALGGMAQTSSVVTGVFGSLGSVLLSFGTVVLGVIKLLASLMTAGGLGGGVGAAGSGLLSNLGSLGSAFSTFSNLIMGKLADSIQSVFNAFGGTGVFGSGLGPASFAGSAANLLADAIPIAGGLIQMALAGINGNIAGLVGGGIGGAIGAFFGGPVGFAIGEMIGNFIGSLIGGFFKGPTPEISGMVRLNSTTLDALNAAQFSGVHSTPGHDNFSWAEAGPLYEEMYKHRTEGNLNREDTQKLIIDVILKTLQEAFAGLDRLSVSLPVDLKSKLSDRINAVLAAGFQITDFKFKDSDVGDMLASFKTWLTGLSGNVLQTVVTQVFGNIDLSALGAGDAAKGFDALTQAMAAMGAIFKALDGQIDTSKMTIAQFASGSVAFFQQFAQQGEAFTDTVKRITQSLGGIITLQDSIKTEIATLTNDTAEAMAIVTSQLRDAEQHVVDLADAFQASVEAMDSPEKVLAAATAVKDAIVQTLQAEIQFATKLHDAVVQLQTDITTALAFLGQLTTQINALSGATQNVDEFLQQAIQAWGMASDNVAARVAIFTSALQVYVAAFQQVIAAGGSIQSFHQAFSTFADDLGRGFQALMQQIHSMSDTKGAIAALQGLAQAIQQGLAAAIQATQAYYARLRQEATDAANAQIAALNAQKQQIQQQYQAQITALTDLSNQATALDTTIKSLASAIKSAQQFFDSLSVAIANLSGTYAPGVIFNRLMADLSHRLDTIRGLTDSQAALSELQALSQEVQADLQAKIQRIQQTYADLRASAQAAAQEQITALQDQRTAVQQHYADLKTAAQDAANARLDALNAEKQAVQDAFTVRKDALQHELDLANQWGTVLSRLKTMQTDIFNMIAPIHPQTSLNEVRSQLQQAFAQFQSSPSPELATQVQDLANQVLTLAKQTPGWELPTANFQGLVAQIQGILSSMTGSAGTHRDPAEIQQQIADLTKQEQDTLKAIDDQIKSTNDALKQTLTTLSNQETTALKLLDTSIATVNANLQNTLKLLSQQEQDKIAAFNARAAAALAAIQAEIQARIVALQAQEADAAAKLRAIIGDKTSILFTADTAAQIKTLQTQQVAELAAIDAQIATVNANLQSTLTSLSQQEQSAIQSLQNESAQWLSQIKGELVNQLGKLQAQEADAAARLQQIIGHVSYEEFIALKQADAAAELHAVTYTLKWYLGTLINKLFPGTGIPTAQSGMEYVPQDGPVFLHQGERVLTAAENSTFATSGKGAVVINFAPTVEVNMTGTESPQRVKDAIDEAVSSLISTPSRTRAGLVRFAREHR